jgi:ABC-type Na+ transport system ATPase subunit NatA
VDAVLATVGLTDVSRKRAGGFSLGMSQRLGIAAALPGDPAALLFDEPVNGLDPEGVRWIRELMKSLAAEPDRSAVQSPHQRNGPHRRPLDRHRPGPAARRHGVVAGELEERLLQQPSG